MLCHKCWLLHPTQFLDWVWLDAIVCYLLNFVVAINFLEIDLEGELKKQVVRPARNSLHLREVVGKVISQREPNCSYSARRILVWLVVEALEGKWRSRRTVEQRRGTLLGVGQTCRE